MIMGTYTGTACFSAVISILFGGVQALGPWLTKADQCDFIGMDYELTATIYEAEMKITCNVDNCAGIINLAFVRQKPSASLADQDLDFTDIDGSGMFGRQPQGLAEPCNNPDETSLGIKDCYCTYTANSCFRECILVLKNFTTGSSTNEPSLVCQVNGYADSNTYTVYSDQIKIYIQETLGPVTDFEVTEVTHNFVKAQWNPPNDVLDGIAMAYNVYYCSSCSCENPLLHEADDKSQRIISIKYESLCNFSTITVVPFASITPLLEGNLSTVQISLAPMNYLMIDSTIQPFLSLNGDEHVQAQIVFREIHNCSCPAQNVTNVTMEIYYKYKQQPADVQRKNVSHIVLNQTCMGSVEAILNRREIAVIVLTFGNHGGNTEQLHPLYINTFDSQTMVFKEINGTLYLNMSYIKSLNNSNSIKGSNVSFQLFGSTFTNSSMIIPKNNENFILSNFSWLYNGAYNVCVSDIGDTTGKCAISDVIVVKNNEHKPNPTPTQTPMPPSSSSECSPTSNATCTDQLRNLKIIFGVTTPVTVLGAIAVTVVICTAFWMHRIKIKNKQQTS